MPISTQGPDIAKYLREWWGSATDDDKQHFLDTVGEVAGGTLGGVSGASMGPVGAVAGAGLGSGAGYSAARLAGSAMGLKPADTPKSGSDALLQTLDAFNRGAIGEGSGRAIPAAYRAGKEIAREGAHKVAARLFAPEPEAIQLRQIAKKYGVNLNLAQATGKKWLQSVEVALDRSPFSVDSIRKARAAQYLEFENAMGKWMEGVRKGEISQEEFGRIAEDSIKQLRDKFNSRMKTSADKAAGSIHPAAVSNVEAGVAVQQGRKDNLSRVADWAEKEYGKIRATHGKAVIDLQQMVDNAKDAMTGIPQDERRRFFPQKALAMLDAGSAEVQRPASTILDASGAPAIPAGTASPKLTLEETMALRSEILKSQRRLTYKSSPVEWEAHSALLDGIGKSMEASLDAVPQTKGVANQIRNINAQYRGYMERLRPPSSKGKANGNPAARVLEAAEQPEKLPKQITSSPTLTKQAITAMSPSTTAQLGGTPMVDPLPPLQRHILDEARRGATVTDQATGQTRFSPSRFEEALPPAAPELYGRKLPSVSGLSKPPLVAREQKLYSDPLPRAIDSGSPDRIMAESFPRRDPDAAANSLAMFNETGNQPDAQRAFAQRLIDLSKTRNDSLGVGRYINPSTLQRQTAAYGETVPAVLRAKSKGLTEITDLGSRAIGEGAFANPSGTSRGNELISFGRQILKPWQWPNMAAHAGAGSYAAKRMYDPKFVDSVIDYATHAPAPLPPPSRTAGPLMGAASRAIMAMPKMSESRKPAHSNGDEFFAADSDSGNNGDEFFSQQ